MESLQLDKVEVAVVVMMAVVYNYFLYLFSVGVFVSLFSTASAILFAAILTAIRTEKFKQERLEYERAMRTVRKFQEVS